MLTAKPTPCVLVRTLQPWVEAEHSRGDTAPFRSVTNSSLLVWKDNTMKVDIKNIQSHSKSGYFQHLDSCFNVL